MGKQVNLIVCKQKIGKRIYQVQKEGVAILRQLKNKKFRIILNISHLSVSNQSFNQTLLGSNDAQCSKEEEEAVTFLNKLTISTHFKQISDNRVLIAFNAYLSAQQSQSKDCQNLIIFGYLAASAVFYHNFDQQLRQQSYLTKMLVKLGEKLQKTDIDVLNQNIKFKTGFQKSPYFLCLQMKNSAQIQDQQNIRKQFSQFYRSESKQNSQINLALSTFIDYFPDRSAMGIQIDFSNSSQINQIIYRQTGVAKIKQLGQQFEQDIVGRQMFGFQFTGSSIENLSFQMCQHFNSNSKINLAHIYSKIILNQKSRALDQSKQFYLKKISQDIFCSEKFNVQEINTINCSILPISQYRLIQKLQRIKQESMKQVELQALNCMNLQEYIQTSKKLLQRIHEYEEMIKLLNKQKGMDYVNQCFGILQHIDLPEQSTQATQNSLTSQQTSYMFDVIQNKLQLFSSECLQTLTLSDSSMMSYSNSFLRLVNMYLQSVGKCIQNNFRNSQLQQRSNRLQIDTLKYQNKRLRAQKKKVQQDYQIQSLIIDQYKLKLTESISENNLFNNTNLSSNSIQVNNIHAWLEKQNIDVVYMEYYGLKKKIEELQEQVKDKNLHIQQLTDILDKFESKGIFQKQQSKMSKQITFLVTLTSNKIQQCYGVFDQIKNIQKAYQNIKKLLVIEKQNIAQERIRSFKQMNAKLSQFQKVKKEKTMLQDIISEQKAAIQALKQVQQQLKQAVDKLQNINGQLTCLRAETQSELQLYKKAAKLTVQQQIKGKSDSLTKFYKFLQDEELRGILKPVIRK